MAEVFTHAFDIFTPRGFLLLPRNLKYAASASVLIIAVLWVGAFSTAIYNVVVFRPISLFPGLEVSVPEMTASRYLDLYNVIDDNYNDEIRHILVDEIGVGTAPRPAYIVRYNNVWFEEAIFDDNGAQVGVETRRRFKGTEVAKRWYIFDIILLQNMTREEQDAVMLRVFKPFIRSSKNTNEDGTWLFYFDDIWEQMTERGGIPVFAYVTLTYYLCVLLKLAYDYLRVLISDGYLEPGRLKIRLLYLGALIVMAIHPIYVTVYFVKRDNYNRLEVEEINTSSLNSDFDIDAKVVPFNPWIKYMTVITFGFLAGGWLLICGVFYLLRAVKDRGEKPARDKAQRDEEEEYNFLVPVEPLQKDQNAAVETVNVKSSFS